MKNLKSFGKEKAVKDWAKRLVSTANNIIIIGRKGSGKSCLAFSLLDMHSELNKRACFVLNFPRPEALPQHITNVEAIEEVPNGGVVFIEEAGIQFNQFSFNSKAGRELADLLKIARHKEITTIFVVQNGQMLIRDARRLVDVYLLREPSLQQMYDEVSLIKRLYSNCFMLFKSSEEMRRKGFFVADGTLMEMLTFDPPNYWTDILSKAFSGKKEIVNMSSLFKEKEVLK